MTISRNGSTVKSTSFPKGMNTSFIPTVGEKVCFYNEYLKMTSVGEVSEVKNQKVSVKYHNKTFIFTLRKNGYWVEKGQTKESLNRKLEKF